jgi:COP9 signalosome complex subunit 1
MAHRDLGDFHRATGDHATALKHYTKSREFCASSQQVLDMCLSVLEVCDQNIILCCLTIFTQLLIEQKSYAHIPTYVFKADTALDAAANTKFKEEKEKDPAVAHASQISAGKQISAERDKVQSKLDFASALAHLGQANYEKAAYNFLRIGSTAKLGDWVGKVSMISSFNEAVYLNAMKDRRTRRHRHIWNAVCTVESQEKAN